MTNKEMIPKLSILTEEQVFGNNKLNIFKVISPKAAVTDTAILRGAFASRFNHVTTDGDLSSRTGKYWLKDSNYYAYIPVVCDSGYVATDHCYQRANGVRVTLPYSMIKNIPHTKELTEDGLYKITYGYYPEQSVSSYMQGLLTRFFDAGNLVGLGHGCTFDKRADYECHKAYLEEKTYYYEFVGQIYARIRANSSYHDQGFTLSNGQQYKNNDYVWVAVKPVTWLMHPDDDVMITEKEIIAGVRFCKEHDGYDGDFNKTELKRFLDERLSREIIMFDPLVLKHFNAQAMNGLKTANHFVYRDASGRKVTVTTKVKR